MRPPADPAWMRVAERTYAASLYLYPKSLRDAHGEDMRQVFRDRCREVARGERSAFRLFALELLPDTLRSAGHEQLTATFGEMRPRQYWSLGLLCCALLGMLFHDRMSGAVLDFAFEAKYGLRNLQEAREMARIEDRVRVLADEFGAQGASLQSRALSAYLYRTIYTGRESMYDYGDLGGSPYSGKMVADGDRANAIALGVLAAHPDAYSLAIAVKACEVALGCNRGKAIGQLIALEPDNAYGWSLRFKWAAQHDDQAMMRAALQGMAKATYFENFQGRITGDLMAAALKLSPDDQEFIPTIGRQARSASYLETEDFRHDIRMNCVRRPSGESAYNSHWVEVNPESQTDCLRLAALLARSTDVMAARWGRRLLYREETDAARREQMLPALRDSEWLWQQQMGSFGWFRFPSGGGREWNLAEWRQWGAAVAPGDGEVQAVRRQLVAQGLPTSAPADFRTPPL